MADEKSSKGTKIKKKKWVQALSSVLFGKESIGEIPVHEPKSLVGRSVTVNLMTLTRDMKKQNTRIRFIITHIKGDQANTELYGYYLNSASIKRLVRRGKDKVAILTICKTSDNKKIRILTMIIPHSKVKGSIATNFRNSASRYIAAYAAKTTFETMIKELITNKLQREIKSALKKIYPARIVEVAKLHIEKEKGPVETKIVEDIKEEPTEEKAEEVKTETKEETPKAKEPNKEEVEKTEEKPKEVEKVEEPKKEKTEVKKEKKAEVKEKEPKTEVKKEKKAEVKEKEPKTEETPKVEEAPKK
jgi:ribosomal protein S3AE